MSRFTQLHLLTSYPPSNLNRDDMGQPKSAILGGKPRLRVSSQCLKRTWRTSDIFQETLKGSVGTRTKEIGVVAYNALLSKGVDETSAHEWAGAIAEQFGKRKKAKKDKPTEDLEIEQLVHVSPAELQMATVDLPAKLAADNQAPTAQQLTLLREDTAADIALFGRMLASSPGFNVEAAAQVAHAITVHAVAAEDDYFTAVDDLNNGEEDMGAAHIGESAFASGLYYTYICIDNAQLHENLDNPELEKQAVQSLVHAAAKVAPKGKQNSYASRSYASYILATKGDEQPCSLSVAFLKPVSSDYLPNAINALTETKENLAKAYGKLASDECAMNAATGDGSLDAILNFVGA